MKRFLLASILVVFAFFANAQDAFPKAFLGHWQGTLQWFQRGRKEPQKVKVQLVVKSLDSANTYTWQIIYGDKNEDNRPYLLRPVDTAKGHWQVDERNGIVIDQYLVGGRFTSAFTVGNTTIVDSYWREGETLVMEFHSYPAKPVSTSGQGTEDSPKVDSYEIRAFQRGVLKRIAGASR